MTKFVNRISARGLRGNRKLISRLSKRIEKLETGLAMHEIENIIHQNKITHLDITLNKAIEVFMKTDNSTTDILKAIISKIRELHP